jgi:hypothetical protein
MPTEKDILKALLDDTFPEIPDTQNLLNKLPNLDPTHDFDVDDSDNESSTDPVTGERTDLVVDPGIDPDEGLVLLNLEPTQRVTVKVEDIQNFTSIVNQMIKSPARTDKGFISFSEITDTLKIENLDLDTGETVHEIKPEVNTKTTQIISPETNPATGQAFPGMQKATVSVKPLLDVYVDELSPKQVSPEAPYELNVDNIFKDKKNILSNSSNAALIDKSASDFCGINKIKIEDIKVAVDKPCTIVAQDLVDYTNIVKFSLNDEDNFGAKSVAVGVPLIETANIKLTSINNGQIIFPADIENTIDLDYGSQSVSTTPIGFKSITVEAELADPPTEEEMRQKIKDQAGKFSIMITPENDAIGFSHIIIPSVTSAMLTDTNKPCYVTFNDLKSLIKDNKALTLSPDDGGTFSVVKFIPTGSDPGDVQVNDPLFTGDNELDVLDEDDFIVTPSIYNNVTVYKEFDTPIITKRIPITSKQLPTTAFDTSAIFMGSYGNVMDISKTYGINPIFYNYQWEVLGTTWWHYSNGQRVDAPVKYRFSPDKTTRVTTGTGANEIDLINGDSIWSNWVYENSDMNKIDSKAFSECIIEAPYPYDVVINTEEVLNTIKKATVKLDLTNFDNLIIEDPDGFAGPADYACYYEGLQSILGETHDLFCSNSGTYLRTTILDEAGNKQDGYLQDNVEKGAQQLLRSARISLPKVISVKLGGAVLLDHLLGDIPSLSSLLSNKNSSYLISDIDISRPESMMKEVPVDLILDCYENGRNVLQYNIRANQAYTHNSTTGYNSNFRDKRSSNLSEKEKSWYYENNDALLREVKINLPAKADLLKVLNIDNTSNSGELVFVKCSDQQSVDGFNSYGWTKCDSKNSIFKAFFGDNISSRTYFCELSNNTTIEVQNPYIDTTQGKQFTRDITITRINLNGQIEDGLIAQEMWVGDTVRINPKTGYASIRGNDAYTMFNPNGPKFYEISMT